MELVEPRKLQEVCFLASRHGFITAEALCAILDTEPAEAEKTAQQWIDAKYIKPNHLEGRLVYVLESDLHEMATTMFGSSVVPDWIGVEKHAAIMDAAIIYAEDNNIHYLHTLGMYSIGHTFDNGLTVDLAMRKYGKHDIVAVECVLDLNAAQAKLDGSFWEYYAVDMLHVQTVWHCLNVNDRMTMRTHLGKKFASIPDLRSPKDRLMDKIIFMASAVKPREAKVVTNTFGWID